MASNRSKRILQSVLDTKIDNIPAKKRKIRGATNLNRNDFGQRRGTSESPIPKHFEDELIQLQDLLGDVFNDENECYSNCDTLIDDMYPVPNKQVIHPASTIPPAKSEKQQTNSDFERIISCDSVNVTVSENLPSPLEEPVKEVVNSDAGSPITSNIRSSAVSENLSWPLEEPEKEVVNSDAGSPITSNIRSSAVNIEVSEHFYKQSQISPGPSSGIDNLGNFSSRTTEIDSITVALDSQSTQRDILNTPLPSPMHSDNENCTFQFCPNCNDFQSEATYLESEPPTPSTTITSIGSPYTPSTSGQRTKTYKTDKGKKRKLHKENWLITKRKTAKNCGKSFTNSKGKIIEEKVLKEPCSEKCRLKCSDVLSERQRLKIFSKFWSIGERSLQWKYVIKYTERIEKGRRTTTETKHNRQYTYIYYLPSEEKQKIKVCKTMFLNTISSGERIISTAWKKDQGYDIIQPDRRGKYDHKKIVIDDEMVRSVCDHVKSFPLVESHRIRKDSTKLYLDGIDSVSRMFKLYCEWDDLKLYSNRARTKRQYRDIVNENFNIAIHRPKKDVCDVCHAFMGYGNPTEAQIKKQDLHIQRKEAARKQKNADKHEALLNEKLVVATFDFQKVLTTPHGEVSILYYKRKLPTLNFTVYNAGNKTAKCYMWHEGFAKRGANEVSSCLYSFIKEHAEKGVEEFRFWSDNCSGQNRNRIVFTLYMLAAKEFNVTITHRFLEKGHTQNEGDSVHSVIERASARKMIYVPEEWYCLVRWAKSEGDPYIVHEMATKDFYNVKELLKNKNWLNNTLNETVQWSRLREVKVNKDQYDRIEYKYDFNQPSRTIVVLRCAGRTNSQRFVREFQLVNAYDGPLPVSYDKHKDLVDMCNSGIIPQRYHQFYKNLPHVEKATKNKNVVSKKKTGPKKKNVSVESDTDTDID